MAKVFKIVSDDAVTSYDMLTVSASTLQADLQTLQFNDAPSDDANQYITVTLFAQSDGAVKADNLEGVLDDAILYVGDSYEQPFWLEVNEDEGNNTVRAVVLGYKLIRSRNIGNQLGHKGFSVYDLYIEHGQWEKTTVTQVTSRLNIVGDYDDETGTNWGRLGGRIDELYVSARGTLTDTLENIWVGVKPEKADASLSTFHPNIYAADYDTLSLYTDTTFSDSGLTGYIETTFATSSDMQQRAFFPFDDWGNAASASPTAQAMRGKYRVLALCKFSDASLVAEMDFSLESVVVSETVISSTGQSYVSHGDTNITLHDCGELDFALPMYTSDWDAYSLYSIGAYWSARKVSGSGNLRVYRFILMPAEHCIKLNGFDLLQDSTTYKLYVKTLPSKETVSSLVKVDSSYLSAQEIPNIYGDWSYPKRGGIIVFAADQSSATLNTSDEADISLDVYSRYKLHRV